KLNLISEKTKNFLESKKKSLLNKDHFYTKKNILKFVQNLKFNDNTLELHGFTLALHTHHVFDKMSDY
ncbi:MAG: hypothetical protein Q8850_02830, partial [Candidatus Phytoplasma australasiaticum]|nr:hypothetical protein [Candidatus Phytoplasma australasiaticum]